MASKPGKDVQQHSKNDRPKIIIKKVKGHGGHHGGAWKVAYADFVTAMMALFLVLWLLGATNSKEKAVIAHYFREPGVFSGSRGVIPHGGEDKLGAGIIQAPTMEVLRAALREGLSGLKELVGAEDQVPITVTDEGVLIEIIDKDKQAFFELSSATIKPTMRKILELIVKQIKNTPNKLAISGHTDARPYHDDSFYSNWELSAARALNTRHVLQQLGLPSERFEQVAGYADRKLRVPDNPLSSENRRISILILKPTKDQLKELSESQTPAAPQGAAQTTK
ncbi:MAG TPA: flagellar motor protein MotB [Terriglobales bacterium]|jgi:chemotaxis protein MotB|nr:flagellar motor protein MotB [Terriglobales bacterium]